MPTPLPVLVCLLFPHQTRRVLLGCILYNTFSKHVAIFFLLLFFGTSPRFLSPGSANLNAENLVNWTYGWNRCSSRALWLRNIISNQQPMIAWHWGPNRCSFPLHHEHLASDMASEVQIPDLRAPCKVEWMSPLYLCSFRMSFMPLFPDVINTDDNNIFEVVYFPVYQDNICQMSKNQISNNNRRLKEKIKVPEILQASEMAYRPLSRDKHNVSV